MQIGQDQKSENDVNRNLAALSLSWLTLTPRNSQMEDSTFFNQKEGVQVQERSNPRKMIYNHVHGAIIRNGHSDKVATNCARRALDTYKNKKHNTYKKGWVINLMLLHIAEAGKFE